MSEQPSADATPAYHTTAEAAEILGLSLETIRRLCRRGVIRSIPIGRKPAIPHAEFIRIARQGIHQSSIGPRILRPTDPGGELYEALLAKLRQLLDMYSDQRLSPPEMFGSAWAEVRELVQRAEHPERTSAITLSPDQPACISIAGASYGPLDLTPTGQPAAQLLTDLVAQFITPLPAEVRERLLRGDYIAAARGAPHALLQIGDPCETYNPVTERFEAGWHVVGYEGERIRVQQDHIATGYYARRREHVRPSTPRWVQIDEEAG